MGTFRQVFTATKFSSIENANKKYKSEVSASERNGIVYVCIFNGKLLGKLKNFVEEKKVEYRTYGANYNGYGYQDHYHEYYLTAKDGKAFIELLNGKKTTEKKVKSDEEVRDEWARSLVKKSKNAVTFEDAQAIAEEKLRYKDERIDAMWSRQDESRASRAPHGKEDFFRGHRAHLHDGLFLVVYARRRRFHGLFRGF